MKKNIPVHDLRLGMYVSELDRPWRETPFLFQGFEVQSDEQIEQLSQYCQHVYIDTEQGYDVSPKSRPSANVAPALILSKEQKEPVIKFEKVLERFTHGHRRPPRYQDVTILEEEIGRAREIVTETREAVYDIMGDVRLVLELVEAHERVRVADHAVHHVGHDLLGGRGVDAAAEAHVDHDVVDGLAGFGHDLPGATDLFLEYGDVLVSWGAPVTVCKPFQDFFEFDDGLFLFLGKNQGRRHVGGWAGLR